MDKNIPKIKKRAIIAIILTILTLLITKDSWLIFKPLPVELVLFGKTGEINVSVAINKKDNNKFSKIRTSDKNVSVKEVTKIEFEIKDIVFPKRLRIDFSNLKNKNPIIIKSISFKNGNIKIKDLDKFVLYGGELKIQNDEIIIYPKEDNLKLYYKQRLKFATIYKIEIELLLIIIILSYLLNYKLTDYIANFSTLKSKSRIEIIFLTLFFTILFLPMAHLDKNEISQKENRVLQKWKPLINNDNTLNYNFGREFDSYFSDRFFLRDFLIKIYYSQFIINKNLRTKKVIKGKDNWLFHGVPAALSMYKNENLFSYENLENVAKLLSEYDSYCKNNNKNFYFFIAPSKSKIYSEYYSEVIKPKKENTLSLAEQLIDYLNKNTNVKAIYPNKELMAHKKDGLLYWKTDTHWNEYGAYIGYQVLMDKLNKDIKLKRFIAQETKEVSEEYGDLNKNLPKGLKIKEFETYKKPIVSDNLYYCQATQDVTDVQNCNGNLNNKKLLMFRDSFTINLIPYLAPTFKNSKFVWRPEVDFDLMKDADVVIFEIVEVNLPKLIGNKMEF